MALKPSSALSAARFADMPVACGFNSCGIQAVGRCHRCDKPFCASHQGIGSLSGHLGDPQVYVDLCARCLASASRPSPLIIPGLATDSERFAADEARERKICVGVLVPSLIAARTDLAVPVRRVLTSRHFEKRWFGRREVPSTYADLGMAWPVGEVGWKEKIEHPDLWGIKKYSSAVHPLGAIFREEADGYVLVGSVNSLGNQELGSGLHNSEGLWAGICRAIREDAQRLGVHEPEDLDATVVEGLPDPLHRPNLPWGT